MADAGTSPWLIVLAGFGGTLITAAAGLVVKFRDRGDKREERRLASMDADRLSAAKEFQDSLARTREDLAVARAEIRDLQIELRAVKQDRTRGWDLARWWNRRAHELRHVAANLIASQPNTDSQAWPDIAVPAFEAPFPQPPETKP